ARRADQRSDADDRDQRADPQRAEVRGGSMNITLRAGERFFINGAVIRIDRKASIELLNEVTFLLENHVMQAEEATTLVRQIYFAVQIILMDPTAAATATPLARSLIESALGAYRAPDLTG